MAELNRDDLFTILKIISNILRFMGLFILVPLAVAVFYSEEVFIQLFLAMVALLVVPFSAIYANIPDGEVSAKHAIISIAVCWFLLGFIGSIPYLASGFSAVNAFFESVSGFSTTGLTMVPDPQVLSPTLGFWRAYTQWLGGFGIVVLALMFFEKPKTAKELFFAEGRSEDFYSNVFKIARMIMAIYLLYTALGIILYLFAGLSLYDAILHCFTALATGGFSTRANGVGEFGMPAMIATLIIMTLGGIGFISHMDLLKGKLRAFFANPEIKFFFIIIAISTLLIFVQAFFYQTFHYFDFFFYVVSALTTTGAGTFFAVAQMPTFAITIILVLMIFGAGYGSTGGAMKLWRVLIVFKAIRREIYKALLPSKAVVPVRLGGRIVPEETVMAVLSFVALYIFVFMVGTLIFMFVPAPAEPYNYSLQEASFTVASAQGTVGLGVIPVGDVRWLGMNDILKILLSLHMILGRMEILPFFIMLKSFGIIRKI
ncbi:MAG: TrkH family potassium uptake protein [Candidatus Diapherotrites archaeon]